ICQLVAEHIYKMEQLGLADIEEPVKPKMVKEVKVIVPQKNRLRKPAKKKQDGENDAGSKETEG
ncbi:hypothetical protein, partial [Pseudomonas aeruginosa]